MTPHHAEYTRLPYPLVLALRRETLPLGLARRKWMQQLTREKKQRWARERATAAAVEERAMRERAA